MTLRELLSSDTPDLTAIEEHLDELEPATRLAECRALGKAQQRRLFHAAKSHRKLTVDDIVPRGTPPDREVVHHGKNSLPMFTHFAKVFCRPDDASAEEAWGYNRNPGVLSGVTGPGYFIARPHAEDREVLVDYLQVPPRRPLDHWPEVRPNEAGFSKFVFGGMQDVLRGVSTHVSIGRATRHGKETDNWFILCREDA